jgi:ubiquitin conjugation factor E4 B
MVEVSEKLAKLTMNDDYMACLSVLILYSKFGPLLEAIANHPRFVMAQSAPNVEMNTILGPFFRISPLNRDVAIVYFASPRSIDPTQKMSAQAANRLALTNHQVELHNIAMAFARAGLGPRNRLLDWFAYVMNVNHKRRAMHVNPKDVASDGFMFNVTAVLDRMCEPFMDTTFSRMERIDVDYLRRDPKLSIEDETKLDADDAQSKAFYAAKAPGESNFVSNVFFLTLAAHHYGTGTAQSKMKNYERDLEHMETAVEQLQEEQQKRAGNLPAQAYIQRQLDQYVKQLERHMAFKFALEGILADEKMQERALLFMRYVTVWLLRVASKSDYTPNKSLQLPLPKNKPEAFSCLPEYALQNIVDNFKYLFRYVPKVLPGAVGDEMMTLSVTFLESSDYIRNPYLKASLAGLLYMGGWDLYHLRGGVLGEALTSSKFANEYLLHALMKFYIECESTGAHTQFYDKFNIRYEIFQVIKGVWPNDHYKRQLTQQSR